MYLLAMVTFSELDMRLMMVQRQLLSELTDLSGSRQESSRTLMRSSAQGPRYLTLSCT